jgi:aldehyde dehydrogenase (NAD+)
VASSPDRTRPAVHLRIGGERLISGAGGTFEHVDPCTGQVDAIIPLAGPADIDHAVQKSQEVFMAWRDSKPGERRRLLLRLADLIDIRSEEFTRRGVLDIGMPVSVGPGLVSSASEWTRYYAGFADKVTGGVYSTLGQDGELSYTLTQPYGVIGIIITWNGALTSLSMKVPPALAAGNTVVVKPSEMTPFASELFADLVEDAGFPEGVVNILPGTASAGAALVEHPLVQKISFTGGPVTASAILGLCAPQMKPAVLELGGKSANLIFEDADVEAATRWGTLRILGMLSGQSCNSPSRMLVQRSIYEDVVDRVAALVKGIRVGDPFDPNTDIGPVVNAAAVDRIMGMIEQAVDDGSRLIAGGSRVLGPFAAGYYIEPTAFADVDPQSELAQREVFGPVLAIMPFEDEDEAVSIANCTKYGLSSYIHTNDLRRAHRVAERLHAGVSMVNGAPSVLANRPFGGVGLSGYGKEGGPAGLAEFQRTKTVAISAHYPGRILGPEGWSSNG